MFYRENADNSLGSQNKLLKCEKKLRHKTNLQQTSEWCSHNFLVIWGKNKLTCSDNWKDLSKM